MSDLNVIDNVVYSEILIYRLYQYSNQSIELYKKNSRLAYY